MRFESPKCVKMLTALLQTPYIELDCGEGVGKGGEGKGKERKGRGGQPPNKNSGNGLVSMAQKIILLASAFALPTNST